jgi:hypothetical protein
LYVPTFPLFFHLNPHRSINCHADSFIPPSASNHFSSGNFTCKVSHFSFVITGFLKKLPAVQITSQSGSFSFLICVITSTKSEIFIVDKSNHNSDILSLIPA